MKHLMLKFTYGVEIGARLAYLGHFKRTKDRKVNLIAYDELDHRNNVGKLLKFYKAKPSLLINGFFYVVGSLIYVLCSFMPLFTLNWVARIMEVFAVFSYEKLAKKYPENAITLLKMAETEKDHEEYFKLGPVRYQNLINLRGSIVGGRLGGNA